MTATFLTATASGSCQVLVNLENGVKENDKCRHDNGPQGFQAIGDDAVVNYFFNCGKDSRFARVF